MKNLIFLLLLVPNFLFGQEKLEIELDHKVQFSLMEIRYPKTAEIDQKDYYIYGEFTLTVDDNRICITAESDSTSLDFCDIIEEIELLDFHDYGESDVFLKLQVLTDFQPWIITMDLARLKFRIIQVSFPFQDGATGYLDYSTGSE